MSQQYPPNISNNNNIWNSLLQQLYSSIATNLQNKTLSNSQINFFQRILLSRFNLIQSDEMNILNCLLDKTESIYGITQKKGERSNIALQKIETINELYTRLTKKKILSKRWAILYLLSELSQTNKQNPNLFITANVLDCYLESKPEMNMDIKALNDIKHNNNNFTEQYQHVNDSKKKTSPIVVNMSKTNKIITERDLINDLLFVFQGIDGHYITFNSKDNAYVLNNIIPWNENIIDIVAFLAELGWLYRKVSHFLNFFNESKIPSQFIQSFSYAVQKELNEYYRLVSFFKKKNQNDKTPLQQDNNNNNSDDELTLKNLVLWTIEPIERMKWLVVSCESVYTLRGSAVISQIYSYVNYSGAEIYLNKVLEEISKPFFAFVRNWIQYGDLQDPYKEFFVNIADKIHEDDLWMLKYQMIYKNVPNFLTKDIAVKIFEIGKCVHFVRNYCNESTFTLTQLLNEINKAITMYEKKQNEEMVIDSGNNNNSNININNTVNINESTQMNEQFIDIESYKKAYDFLTYLDEGTNTQQQVNQSGMNIQQQQSSSSMFFFTSLMSNIDLIHSLINKEVINIFYNKFHFKENLTAINRYLLLGQGDMMQLLMESLFDELKKPASHIYKHNLQANLESAIRASNAKYNDEECLKKLNIKLLDANIGDTGWDIFTLEYNVEPPLTVIFNRTLLREYQRLFFFFWKLKRLEFSQNHQIWRKFMTYAHTLRNDFDEQRSKIHRAMLFNQQVIHFVSNLHNFLALEVLETQYKKIIDKIPTVKSLDELIQIHKEFVNNIINQSLLKVENNPIYKKILHIFDLIINFRTVLDVLTALLLENLFKGTQNYLDDDNSYLNKQQYSRETFNQIKALFNEFQTEVNELINSIEYSGKGNMKFLRMKLDYNEYYSVLEKERDLKQEKEMMNKALREENERRRLQEEENNRRNNDDDEGNDDGNYGGSIGGEFREDPSGLDYYRYPNNYNLGISNDNMNMISNNNINVTGNMDVSNNINNVNDNDMQGEEGIGDENDNHNHEIDNNDNDDDDNDEEINTNFNKKTYEVLNYSNQRKRNENEDQKYQLTNENKSNMNIYSRDEINNNEEGEGEGEEDEDNDYNDDNNNSNNE